ncbi:hypothetical protein MASR2M12_06250 [Bacteroidales bacterium]
MKHKYAVGLFFTFWFIGYSFGQVDNAKFIDEHETVSFHAVLNVDSASWNMTRAELPGLIAFEMYCKSNDSLTYADRFINLYHPQPQYYSNGQFREDTATGQLWYKTQSNVERLILDMSLELGESFEIFPGIWSTVESVSYQNNRKIIQFEWYSLIWKENLLFIEGVGRNIGLFFDELDYAACKYENGELVYVNQNTNLFDGCVPDPVKVNENNPDEPEVSISFNCSKQIHIRFTNPISSKTMFTVFNLLGNQVYECMLSADSQFINLDFLKSGIYVFMISNADGSIKYISKFSFN